MLKQRGGESRVKFLIGTVIFTILQKMQNFYRIWQEFCIYVVNILYVFIFLFMVVSSR